MATTLRDEIKAALSEAGAFCGECGFEPGDTGCPDCQRCHDMYATAVLAVVHPLLDAQRAEVDAAHARCADWEQAHRKLVARCGQLRFAIRVASAALRATADRLDDGAVEPIQAETLRRTAVDLDAMADTKEPS
jgi:hypothetical protein